MRCHLLNNNRVVSRVATVERFAAEPRHNGLPLKRRCEGNGPDRPQGQGLLLLVAKEFDRHFIAAHESLHNARVPRLAKHRLTNIADSHFY